MTRPVRMHDHPDGRIWVFDPERIAEPNRKHTTWVWNLIDSIHTIADAKRIADCWRYASGQPSTGGDDFFHETLRSGDQHAVRHYRYDSEDISGAAVRRDQLHHVVDGPGRSHGISHQRARDR